MKNLLEKTWSTELSHINNRITATSRQISQLHKHLLRFTLIIQLFSVSPKNAKSSLRKTRWQLKLKLVSIRLTCKKQTKEKENIVKITLIASSLLQKVRRKSLSNITNQERVSSQPLKNRMTAVLNRDETKSQLKLSWLLNHTIKFFLVKKKSGFLLLGAVGMVSFTAHKSRIFLNFLELLVFERMNLPGRSARVGYSIYGHIVSYGDTSGVHEMTIALLGIDQNAIRWEKLGLGTASDILHRTLLVLQQAQRLPAHRRPPHAFVLGACAIKLSLYHPSSQRHWLHITHDAFVTPFTDSQHIRLRGFSAGSYTASVVALLLANQQTPWRIQLTMGAYAGPATVLTALCVKAATGQVTTSIVHLQADQLCLWGSTDISCFQIPPRFRICYITGQPRWMHAPFHNYAHLLEVQLPTGVHEAHQLVLELADLIPYKRRLGTPLRLITWMRMRTTNLEDSSRHIVNALRSPNPVQYLLQGYNVNTVDQAKAILFSQFDLTPCDTKDAIPPALCQWLKQLVQHHLQDLPLLELSTLISLFLPQIPRESLRTRNLHSLHPPPNILALTRLHDGIGGMDQYQLTLTGWPPPLIFVPSSIDLTWQEWLDESNNFKQIQFGVTIGDILCLCVEPHLFQDPDADPWGMGTIARPLPPRSLVFAAIVTATHVKPSKSKPHHTEADKALLRANYRQIEFAIIPAPQGLVHFPPPHHLPHAQQPLEWADTATLKAIPACRLLYVSHRGTIWNCSHLVQLAETHKHHKPLTLGIPVQAPFTPAPSTHHEAIVTSLRNLVDILMLNRPSLCPALAPLAQHICETAATDSSHFVAVLSSVYLSLLTGRKALNIQGVFEAAKQEV